MDGRSLRVLVCAVSTPSMCKPTVVVCFKEQLVSYVYHSTDTYLIYTSNASELSSDKLHATTEVPSERVQDKRRRKRRRRGTRSVMRSEGGEKVGRIQMRQIFSSVDVYFNPADVM